KSDNVDVQSGDASGSNSASTFTGLAAPFAGLALENNSTATTGDLNNIVAKNIQEGDNRTTVRQTVNSSSGDGIAGQVLGVTGGGKSVVNASNKTTNSDVTSGSADSDNSGSGITGLVSATAVDAGLSDITNASGSNLQEGDNTSRLNQTSDAVTG